jgi:hypothetical protein
MLEGQDVGRNRGKQEQQQMTKLSSKICGCQQQKSPDNKNKRELGANKIVMN